MLPITPLWLLAVTGNKVCRAREAKVDTKNQRLTVPTSKDLFHEGEEERIIVCLKVVSETKFVEKFSVSCW
jgi:hypothetical protein